MSEIAIDFIKSQLSMNAFQSYGIVQTFAYHLSIITAQFPL